MTARIVIDGVEATIKDYHWTCADKAIEDYLNARLSPYGPSPSDPNPDLSAALHAVDELGAELVDYDEVERKPGVIY